MPQSAIIRNQSQTQRIDQRIARMHAYKSDSLNRASPYASGRPTPTPIKTIDPTSLTIRNRTSPATAPSAMRMPISRVRLNNYVRENTVDPNAARQRRHPRNSPKGPQPSPPKTDLPPRRAAIVFRSNNRQIDVHLPHHHLKARCQQKRIPFRPRVEGHACNFCSLAYGV